MKMALEINCKLFISVSDMARAEESQKVIKELTRIYDNNKAKDADMIRVTPWTLELGYLKGINISIKCISKDEAKKYKKEFNIVFRDLTYGAKRKPFKHITLIDLEQLKLIEKF